MSAESGDDELRTPRNVDEAPSVVGPFVQVLRNGRDEAIGLFALMRIG